MEGTLSSKPRLILDIRNDTIDLGIGKEKKTRGKSSRTVEFSLDLLLDLGEVKPRDYTLRVNKEYQYHNISREQSLARRLEDHYRHYTSSFPVYGDTK